MKRFINFCMLALIVFTSFVFVGCKDKDFSVYIFVGDGGSITINEDKDRILLKEVLTLDEKVDIKLKAYPNEGYVFHQWILGTEVYSDQPEITLTVSEETTIKAVFRNNATTYTVTYKDANGVNLSSETIKYGETFKYIPAVPQIEGYTGAFYIGDKKIQNGEAFKYTSSQTATLKYTINTYTISVPTSDKYTISLYTGYNSWTVNHNADIKFKVAPINSGDTIKVYVNNQEISANYNGVYTISNIKENKTITIAVNGITTGQPANQYGVYFDTNSNNNISVQIVSNNSVKIDNKYYVAEGESLKFKLSSSNSNEILTVKVNNTSIEPDSQGIYTISNIRQAVEVDVLTTTNQGGSQQNTISVTFDKKGNSNIKIDVLSSVVSSSNSVYVITSNSDIRFKVSSTNSNEELTVKFNNQLIPANNQIYTISNIQINITITIETTVNEDSDSDGEDEIDTVSVILDNYKTAYFTLDIKSEYIHKVLTTYTIEEGEEFEFKVVKKQSEDVIVFVNGLRVEPDSTGLYSITDINYNVKISFVLAKDLANYTPSNMINTLGIKINTNNNPNLIVKAKSSLCAKVDDIYYFSKTIVEKFKFEIDVASGHENSKIKVLFKGDEIEPLNGIYSITIGGEHQEVSVIEYEYLTVNYSIDYGKVGGVAFEDTITDYDYIPYYEATCSNYYESMQDEGITISADNQVNCRIETGYDYSNYTWQSLVEYINNIELDTSSNYRIKQIKMFNANTGITVEDFCKISYDSGNKPTLTFADNCFKAEWLNDNTLTLIWESYNN